MDRVFVALFDVSFKSASRNLKSAMVSTAVLFAFVPPKRSSRRNSTDRLRESRWRDLSSVV